jgi:hypothetical protein
VGHAMIRRLNLPVLGRQEDAADQFALWFVLEKEDDSFGLRIGKVSAFSAALMELTDGELSRGSSFTSTHSLAIQRAANVACWTAGYARLTGQAIEAFEAVLPPDRRGVCEEEYPAASNSLAEASWPDRDSVKASTRYDLTHWSS